MEFEDIFSQQQIHDVLKSAFQYTDESKISFLLDNSSDNKNFFLNVKHNNAERNYILAKINKSIKIEKKSETKNLKVLYPAFILDSNNKDSYGAFESPHGMDHLVSPEKNSLVHLKIILENLAEHQSLDLATWREDGPEEPSEYDLKDLLDKVTSLDAFKDLDAAAIKKSAENLQVATNKLLDDSSLLVSSIGCPFAENVYVNKDTNKSIFLRVSSTKKLPPAHDALLYIFALSDEKFRQEYFETLTLHYFESLSRFLQNLQSNKSDKISRYYSEHQVKVLLPVVKLKIASSVMEKQDSSNLSEILTNLRYFFNYPLINQEDIYEVIKNRIKSCEYNLLNYNLTSLSEKNGHLGQYFHLNISIKVQEEIQELKLFAKFIITPLDMLQSMVENGPAKKEDFFYKTLIPLCINHGLESLIDFAPKCYLSRAGWLLVLDDLSAQYYVAFKPNVSLGYDGLKASVENFAKLHACSLLLEEILSKESEKKIRFDEQFGEFLNETIFVYGDDENYKQMSDSTIKCFKYIIEKLPEVSNNLNLSLEDIKAQVSKSYMSLPSKIRKSKTIRNVINHGDGYVANMLFKFGEEKVITKGLLIDFQLLRYTSPSFDLLFFLYIASSKETRDKYLNVLLEEYNDHITKYLEKFNYDPEVVFPRETFDKDIKYTKDAAIVAALGYALMMQLDPNVREEIFQDNEKFVYYFVQNHRHELVDLVWENEHSRNIYRGLIEDTIIANDTLQTGL